MEQLRSESWHDQPEHRMANVHQMPNMPESTEHLPNSGGVFLSEQLPSQVVTLDPVDKPKREGNITVKAFRVTTDDGHNYITKTFYPDLQVSPIRVHQTTPLGTHTKRDGYPYEISKKIAKNGFVTTLVSAEVANMGSLLGLLPGVRPSRTIDMHKTIHNNLAILNAMDEYDGNIVEHGRSIETGASRGGMTANGVAAEAHKFDRSVMYVDSIADCFVGKENLRQNIIDQIVEDEIICIAGLARHHNINYLIKSTKLDPRFLANVVHVFRALEKNGRNEYLSRIPDDTYVHLTKFDDDKASQPELTQQLVANKQNIKLDRRPGPHMAIVRKENIALHIGRFARLREVIREGVRELDEESFKRVVTSTSRGSVRQPKDPFSGVAKQLYLHSRRSAA